MISASPPSYQPAQDVIFSKVIWKSKGYRGFKGKDLEPVFTLISSSRKLTQFSENVKTFNT